MEMSNLLSSVSSYPDKQFIPFLRNFQVSGNISRPKEHFPDYQCIRIVHGLDTLNPLLWDNQNVNRSERMDVFERQNVCILIDNISRNLFADNFLKNSILHIQKRLDIQRDIGLQDFLGGIDQLLLGHRLLCPRNHILHDSRTIKRLFLTDDNRHFDSQAVGDSQL